MTALDYGLIGAACLTFLIGQAHGIVRGRKEVRNARPDYRCTCRHSFGQHVTDGKIGACRAWVSGRVVYSDSYKTRYEDDKPCTCGHHDGQLPPDFMIKEYPL